MRRMTNRRSGRARLWRGERGARNPSRRVKEVLQNLSRNFTGEFLSLGFCGTWVFCWLVGPACWVGAEWSEEFGGLLVSRRRERSVCFSRDDKWKNSFGSLLGPCIYYNGTDIYNNHLANSSVSFHPTPISKGGGNAKDACLFDTKRRKLLCLSLVIFFLST